jgi:hypothetical protein
MGQALLKHRRKFDWLNIFLCLGLTLENYSIRISTKSQLRPESGSRNKNLDPDPQPCLTLDGAHTILLNDHSANGKKFKISN